MDRVWETKVAGRMYEACEHPGALPKHFSLLYTTRSEARAPSRGGHDMACVCVQTDSRAWAIQKKRYSDAVLCAFDDAVRCLFG